MSKHKFLFRHSSLYAKSSLAQLLNPGGSTPVSPETQGSDRNNTELIPVSSSLAVLQNPFYQDWQSYDDNVRIENNGTEDIRNYTTTSTVSHLAQYSEEIYGDFQTQDHRQIQEVQSDYYGGLMPYYNANAYEVPQNVQETFDRQIFVDEEQLEDTILTPNTAEFNPVTAHSEEFCPPIGGTFPVGSNQTSVIRKNHLAKAKRTSVAPDSEENPPETVPVTQPVVQDVEEVCSSANPNIMILLGDPIPYKCKVCLRKFKSKNNFKYHLHGSSAKAFTYTCEICGKGMFASTHYRYHLLTHSAERAHKCSVCSKGFLTELKLKRHMKIHTDEKSYGCNQCTRKFYSSKELESHVTSHNVSKSSPNRCRICFKDFQGSAELNAHVTSHGEQGKYKCTICGRGFQRQKHLENHSSVHTGEKPFVCQRCGKSFRTETSHTHHMKAHSDERPHACKVCGRGFVLKKDCLRHENVHNKDSPFSCPSCDKTFRRQDNRDRHVKIYHLEGRVRLAD